MRDTRHDEPLGLDEVRADLEGLGVEVDPDAKVQFYPTPQGMSTVIIVDRVADITGQPEYCVHGYATCAGCGEYCYLGSESVKVILEHTAAPMCMVCALAHLPEDAKPITSVHDNLRAEGPHE